MPARLPRRPPLAMKLWLAQRFGRAREAEASPAAPGHALGKTMNIESLDHLVRSRVRIFLRNTRLVTILGTIILGVAIWMAIHITLAPTELRVAAGPPGSANVKFVELLAQRFAAEHDKIQLHLVATAGPKESAAAMTNGGADLAILPSTLGNSPDWPVVAILRQNVLAFVVPTQPPPAAPVKKAATTPAAKEVSVTDKKETAAKPEASPGKIKPAKNDKGAKDATNAKNGKGADKGADKTAAKDADQGDDTDGKAARKDDSGADADANDSNKLDKIAKLAGHRIAVVTGNEATQDLLDVVLDHYGVPPGQARVSPVDPNNIADAVKMQQIDALFVAGSATGQAITDVVGAATLNGQAPTFIAIDQADGIAKRRPAFDSIDVDAGIFGGNPPAPSDDLKSLSFAEYLVAKKSVPHDAVAALAKLIYTSRLALAAAMPGEIKIQAPPTDKDARVVVHPGALAYLTDDQKTFFDKYGDDIFYGLLIFPIFGSVIAAVASYFRSGGRTRRLRLLQRVLDLVRKAHTAPSLEALDKLEADVDQLVIAIIHQAEHEEYDQTMQMSFSLALDQARFAIDSRRTILLGQGGSGAKPGAQAAAA
jgi:TRAP-type uncharacterized transport system substrate-binding protein